MIKVSPVAFGILRNSWQQRPARVEDKKVIGTVSSSATQAVIIDDGARPHFPPVDAIALWAQRKIGLSREEAKKAAFPIARRINRRGLPRRSQDEGLFSKAFIRITPKIEERFNTRLERFARKFSK